MKCWLKDGSFVSAVQSGFKTGFYRITADGKPESMAPVAVNPGRSFAAAPGKIVFVGQTAIQQPEIYLWDGKEKPEKISRFNQQWEKLSLVAVVRKIPRKTIRSNARCEMRD